MVLPLLPTLDDFDLSLPFMSESFSSSTYPSASTTAVSHSTSSSTSAAAAPPPSSSSSSSYSHSRPPASPAYAPLTSQYLTSQSSRVQDFLGPSPAATIRQHALPTTSTGDRAPAMRSTTFNSTGTILQHDPLDVSRLEISDYFTQNAGAASKGPGPGRTEDKAAEHDRQRARKPTSTTAAVSPASGTDLLSPSRFIIQRPSGSGVSQSSRPTSPSPSMASSALSEQSSRHSGQQPPRGALDAPLRQQPQTSNASVADSARSAPVATAARSADASPRTAPVSSSASSSFPTVVAQPQRQGASPATSSSSIGPSPKKVTTQKQSLDAPQGPNLRARISRLFRHSPKQERTTVLDQRYRSQQRQLYQDSLGVSEAQRQQQQEQKQHQQKQQPQQKQQASPLERPQPAPAQHQISAAAATTVGPAVLVLDQEKGAGSVQSGTRQSPPTKSLQDPSTDQEPDSQPLSATRPTTVSTPAASPNPSTSGVVSVLESTPATPSALPYSSLKRQENKARQRRVSSVSSIHSIRQVGSYAGSGASPSKMISPARKANPYYTGVIARFSNNGKHSPHDRDLSSSGKRRSMVSVGGERARVGAEINASKEKLSEFEQSLAKSLPVKARSLSMSSNASSIISEAKERESLPPLPVNQEEDEDSITGDHATQQHMPLKHSTDHSAFSPSYDEEYDVERDETARNNVRGSPFAAKTGYSHLTTAPCPSGRPLFGAGATTSIPLQAPMYSRERTTSNMSNESQESHDSEDSQDSRESHEQERRARRAQAPSVATTWSTATGGPTDAGTIPDSVYSTVPPSESHATDADADVTPSGTTLSSAQMEQGVIITDENWTEDLETLDEKGHEVPRVLIQRPSMDVSILPNQPPFAQARRLSASSTTSAMSEHHKGHPPLPPQRYPSLGQWSESSYDPCAPLRWDELFEMDPNSKGPLWLSGRGLGQIPHEFFDGLRNLRELYLDHNDIKVVPDSLLKLSKLDVLDLSNNSISSFHSAFKLKKLKNMRRLNLDNNMLTDISPIYKLKQLRELRLNCNFVPYLAIAIQNMTKLKILAMESNQLATLPETMGRLGNLCELRLSDNNLRALPESIGSIRTLQVLALRSNLLETLPESWKDMENLSTLDLACNRLTTLPADIVRLPKLTHLDLHDNQIQALPEKMGQLSNLVVLQLCNNHLRELPRDIGRLRDLQDLVLSFNQLQFLPDEIGKLNKLLELKFDNNPLRSLPKTIQRLTNVRRVHLQGCELRDLPVELGVAFKELVYLDLSGNQFEAMPVLDQMTKLEEFYISNNYLREIGTSSLNLQSSSNSSNSYNSGTISGSMTNGPGAGSSHPNGSAAQGGHANGTVGTQSGSATVGASGTQGSGAGNGGTMSMMGGGMTASKLSELKRLRVFEAHHNQIRVLTSKIKLLSQLEVLDLGDNLLTWLPKEVGELADLKVLILEGNPIKSLPSSLTKLMGSLEVFRIGEWPENGFEITREQAPMNMKINVLQSFMPQQIERTLLLRMHDSILKRMQELDSQQYRDQHGLDRSTGTGAGTGAGAGAGPGNLSRTTSAGSSRVHGTTFSLSASTANALQLARSGAASTVSEGGAKTNLGISQGLAIATQNMMINRSFALPPTSPSNETPTTPTLQSASDHTKGPLLTVNSEGINPNYVDHPPLNVRTIPTLQISTLRGHSAPISTSPMSGSPQTATVSSSPLSAFPLFNSLRPRKSHQQLSLSKGLSSAAGRPKSMYTLASPQLPESSAQPQEQLQVPQTPKLSNRMSRVFDFASGNNRQKNGSIEPSKVSTLESSRLQLSTDAMMALGLGTQPGSAGSVIAHSHAHGSERLGFELNHQSGSRLGDGSLTDIRFSMAIKSSPSLTSIHLPLFSPGPNRPPNGIQGTKALLTRGIPPLPGHVSASLQRSSSGTNAPVAAASGRGGPSEKSATSLPWLRLKSSTMPFSASSEHVYQQHGQAGDYPGPSTSVTSIATSHSTSSLLLHQPNVNGQAIAGPAPPPIRLEYELGSSSLDIPPHLYYSAGGDDVDGDHPEEEDRDSNESLRRVGDGLGIDGETEEEDGQSVSTAGGGEGPRRMRVLQQKGKTRVGRSDSRSSREVQWQHEQYLQQQQLQQLQSHHQQQLHATDPVLKIAVLKGIYDQILQNVDQMAEPHLPESPAKKNNRFKLLNTLKFLKADRSASSGSGSGATFHHPHQQQQQQQQLPYSSQQQHHATLPYSSAAGHHPVTMMTQ
ncbi:unnamed protein product [Mortierella alpina]